MIVRRGGIPLETCQRVVSWANQTLRPALTPDVSSYAQGRLRVWLGVEPPLGPTQRERPGFPVGAGVWGRLTELIGWPFDYCLFTYSGDSTAIGISPHRDAGYAGWEAVGVNWSSECTFSYWEGRKGLGPGPDNPLVSNAPVPTHCVYMRPGDIIHFNCKNRHSATPLPGRWGANFWRFK